MRFPVSDAGGAREPLPAAVPAPPDLSLIVERLVGALALDEADLAIIGGDGDWGTVAGARAVVAFAHDSDAPLEALAQLEADAAANGWHVAHAGLLVTTSRPDGGRSECPLMIACRPCDDELARLVETGPLGVALDPCARPAAGQATARVLVASYEVTGPTGNGGIGTAYHSLAHVLAAAGHDVTVLFTGWLDPELRDREPEWRAAFAEAGIAFELLGTPWDSPVRSPHHAVRRAYELHHWLADAHARRPFDVVHLPECQGHGAFAQTAKALGLAYADVEFVVGTHSSTRWIGEANREGLESVDQLAVEQLERLSVERADVLLSPSAYLVDYMRARRWRLPQRTFVQQYARPQSVRALTAETQTPHDAPPTELVFFGRLETRKGLETFCDAVDLLVAESDCPFERITLLGRPERVVGEAAEKYVARRARTWHRPWAILPDLGHTDAVAYLRAQPCVVAIPSLVDNSPNTVSEVIALGVPFVASRSGGTAELIAPGDLARTTFDGWGAGGALEPPTFADDEAPFDARALAGALRTKAADASARAAPAVDAEACDRVYDVWHRALAARAPAARPVAGSALHTAAVLLIEADHGDVARIAAALARGTRRPSGVAALCEPDAGGEPLASVVWSASGMRGQGRSRADALAALDGDIAIVLRGCDEPDPALVERVCAAMAASDGDVLSLVVRDPRAVRADDVPPELRRTDVPGDLRAFVPAPGPAAAAIAYPALSVGPYAIRREALSRLDGWADDLWGEALDHELLARAALAGMRIDVLPDPLVTSVRDDRWADMRAHHWGAAPFPAARGEEQIRLLRPFRRTLPEDLADLPALLVGALRISGDAHDQRAAHAAERREIVSVYEARVREQRELIALYERRQEDLREALARHDSAPPAVEQPVRARGPVAHGVRFARWSLTHLARRNPR